MDSKPLGRFTVLDLTRVRSGPAAVRQFADWGATVIKIEEPGDEQDDKPGGSAQFADYQNTHRNKRSVTLNLKTEEGKRVFKQLAEKADIVLENLRPGVMDKLGLGYADLKPLSPGLIYVAISGYGHSDVKPSPVVEPAGNGAPAPNFV